MWKSKNAKETKYVQPKVPKSGYSFVLAGAIWRAYEGRCVYVKYCGGKKNTIEVKEASQNHIWLKCPDRELVIVGNSQYNDAFRPYGDSFDACYDFSIFTDIFTKSGLNLDYIMTNFVHSGSDTHPRIDARSSHLDRIQVLSDSGGLQMARGVKNIICPKALMEFYNSTADAGMCLDLPLFNSSLELVKKAAAIQKRSNAIMLKVSKGPEIINIFHGQTIEERMLYRSIVETPEIDRVAIGGTFTFSPLANVNMIYSTLDSKVKYKQCHVLGNYTSGLVPLMVKIANTGAKPHITSDSTSMLQASMNKEYYHQQDSMSPLRRVGIGSRASVRSVHRHLPCHCPICSVFKYSDILGFLDHRYVRDLFAIHNAYAMQKYADFLQHYCLDVPRREYNALVETHLKKTSDYQSVRWALDYIDRVEGSGLASAQSHYRNHIVNNPVVPNGTVSLVSEQDGSGNGEVSAGLTRMETLEKLKAMSANLDKLEAEL